MEQELQDTPDAFIKVKEAKVNNNQQKVIKDKPLLAEKKLIADLVKLNVKDDASRQADIDEGLAKIQSQYGI